MLLDFKFHWELSEKIDGVGPADNIPSPDKLHHFVRKNKL